VYATSSEYATQGWEADVGEAARRREFRARAGRQAAGGRTECGCGLRAAGCGQREMEKVGEEEKEEKRGSGWASGQVSEWVTE
jgi:hypothetical protein